MATLEQLGAALQAAHAAGDTDNAEVLAQAYSAMKAPRQDTQPSPAQVMPWSNVGTQVLSNFPESTANIVGGVADAVMHPVNTVTNLHDILRGGAQNTLPESWRASDSAEQQAKADLVGHFYKDRYGSEEGFKKALASDPAGVMADAATLFTGGAGLATKVPALAGKSLAVSKALDPLILASKAPAAVGNVAAEIVGGLGTHTGAESLRLATKAGLEGGQKSKDFIGNLRGNVPMTDVLDKFKQNLQQMGADKSAAYRDGMAQVSGDKSVLDFNGIDNALADSFGKITFKGQAKNQKALDAHTKIAEEINAWKSLEPAEFHTPEGLDALKQRIGGIQESIPFEERTARMAAGGIYNAVKDEIVKQAPVYAKTMKDYHEATDLITEMERTLSLKGTASVDTSMRKLQSLMRNNVNTNYGNRLNLANQLEQKGGNEVMSSLAGQALNSWTARGFGRAVMGATGAGAGAAGGILGALPVLAVQSPRLMGEMAHAIGSMGRFPTNGAGIISGLAEKIGVNPGILANILYQEDKQKQITE